jgi:hypothetical protein
MALPYILRGVVLIASAISIICTIALFAVDEWYSNVWIGSLGFGNQYTLATTVGPFQMCESGIQMMIPVHNCGSLVHQCYITDNPPNIKAVNDCSVLVASMVTSIFAFIFAVIAVSCVISEALFRRHRHSAIPQFIGIGFYVLATILYFVTIFEVVGALVHVNLNTQSILGVSTYGKSFYLCLPSAVFMLLSTIIYIICAIVKNFRFNVIFVSGQLNSPLIGTQLSTPTLPYQPPQHSQYPAVNGQPQYANYAPPPTAHQYAHPQQYPQYSQQQHQQYTQYAPPAQQYVPAPQQHPAGYTPQPQQTNM